MVLIDEKKYACETCIKGHRSSACKHVDRPLYEIKKKGRPVTQCEHCRELRKTKQVHVKCICESKDVSTPKAEVKKGATKLPERAAFPNGYPEALENNTAPRSRSAGSSHSDRSGEGSSSSPACSCDSGGECSCCTPRVVAPRRRKKAMHESFQTDEDYIGLLSTSDKLTRRSHELKRSLDGMPRPNPTPSHVLARISELRPVLPRPMHSEPQVSVHDPSSGIAHGHSYRHHTHDNMFFSPYGRAHEQVHALEHNHQLDDTHSLESEPTLSSESETPEPLPQPNYFDQAILQSPTTWYPEGPALSSTLCGCGDGCTCPGCVEHNGSMITTDAFASCANPATCALCLDCTILSLPTSLPPDTAESIYDPTQSQSIDDWIRQVGQLPTSSPLAFRPQSELPPYFQAPWETLQLPPIIDQTPQPLLTPEIPSPTCGAGSCKCPPGLCTCGAEYCETCSDTFSEENLYDPSAQRSLTFETSGERDSCLAGALDDKNYYNPKPKQEPLPDDNVLADAFSLRYPFQSQYQYPNPSLVSVGGRFLAVSQPQPARARSSSVSSAYSHLSSVGGGPSISSSGESSPSSRQQPKMRLLLPKGLPPLNHSPLTLTPITATSCCSSKPSSPPMTPEGSRNNGGYIYANGTKISDAKVFLDDLGDTSSDGYSVYDNSLDNVPLYQ